MQEGAGCRAHTIDISVSGGDIDNRSLVTFPQNCLYDDDDDAYLVVVPEDCFHGLVLIHTHQELADSHETGRWSHMWRITPGTGLSVESMLCRSVTK